MSRKKNYQLQSAWIDGVKNITDEQAGILFKAILNYANHNIVYTGGDPIIGFIFNYIKESFDSEDRSYDSIVTRNRENGKKGGRPIIKKETPVPIHYSETQCPSQVNLFNLEEIAIQNTPEVDVYPFDNFWNDYDKKVGRKEKLIVKWKALSNKNKLLIKEHIPKYKIAQPEKRYRKNPETYLNNFSWLDEIISDERQSKHQVDPIQRRRRRVDEVLQ